MSVDERIQNRVLVTAAGNKGFYFQILAKHNISKIGFKTFQEYVLGRIKEASSDLKGTTPKDEEMVNASVYWTASGSDGFFSESLTEYFLPKSGFTALEEYILAGISDFSKNNPGVLSKNKSK